jgi:transposase
MQPPTPVWLVVEPVDMRLGIDGLTQYLQTHHARRPCAGGLYAFSNRRKNRLKVLLWDGAGVWLSQRRLHQGSFIWPPAGAARCEVTPAQWQWLICGVDWQRLDAPVKIGRFKQRVKQKHA